MNRKTSSTHPSADSSPRNPRVHRQTGIPSISRPRTSTSGGISDEIQTQHGVTSVGSVGAFGSLKQTAYHLFSKANDTSHSLSHSRPRFATMPPQRQQSSIDTQVRMDLNRNEGSRGAVSPPIIDFTNFEDTYREPRAGNLEGLMSRRTTGRAVRSSSAVFKSAIKGPGILVADEKPVPVTGAPLPASARKPDPRLILSSLESVLGAEKQIDNYLNAHELLAIHQLDQVDFEDRDRMRAKLIQHGKLDIPGRKSFLTVLGEPIRKASIYSSTSMVLAGREHELPIIVVNTVEELYRTGIYQPNLFRTLPNRARLLELIDIYDSEEQQPKSVIRSRQSHNRMSLPNAGFGANTSLHLESTPDVCALLTTYLSSLSEPILPHIFFRPIWDWCGLDDEDTQSMQLQDSFGSRLSHIPLARTYTSPTESTHILVAQLLLQLLPSPNFSLLVYLLAFFSQAALVREENGVGVSDLSRMFGRRLFGGDVSTGESTTHEILNIAQPRRDGEAMMNWFLRRWGPLSDGLFDVVEDAKLGLFRRPLARRDSFGKDILPSWLPGVGSREHKQRPPFSSDSSDSNDTHNHSLSSTTTIDLPNSDPMILVPRIQLDGTIIHSTPKSRFNVRGSPDSLSAPTETVTHGDFVLWNRTAYNIPDETLDITQLPSRIDNSSISSTAALDERLLDISMPTLLNQTLPAVRVSLDDALCHVGPRNYTNRETQTSTTPSELVHALQLTTHLELQLEERTNALTNALAELTKSKLNASKLHRRVYELEVELDEKRASKLPNVPKITVPNAYEDQLEATIKERNDARDIVSEIKKLVRN